jgi:homoserine dehydrogenase
VRPEKLSPTNSLFHVGGASSAVRLETAELGPITVLSEDPTNSDTAFGLLTDFLNVHRGEG